MADVSLLGTYAGVELLPGGRTGVVVIQHLPGPATFRLWSRRAYNNE